MKPGTQIAYIPNHANGDIIHPDVEFGFVISESTSKTGHFCRYWVKGEIGNLRIRANSESTPNENLVEVKSVPQAYITALMKTLEE
jgi:hypothetical protein